jgi:enoyl-CoA hydratase
VASPSPSTSFGGGRVLLSVQDGTALVRLADRNTRNALTAELTAGIVEAFDTLESDLSVHAVVLAGEPDSFSSGGYLPELENPVRELADTYAGFLRVAACRLPTIGAVDGPALGAGMNLVLGCDLVLVSPRARFESRFLSLALHPGGAYAWRLRQQAGLPTAMALSLFGEGLDAEGAVRVGLAWRLVHDDVVAEALAVAARLTRVPRDLLVITKESVLAAGPTTTEAAAVEADRANQAYSMAQPEFRARVREVREVRARRG